MATSTSNTNTDLNATRHSSLYRRKYYALKRKCEEIQETNEKLVNRIQYARRILRRDIRAKRFMIAKLDRYRDNYMNLQVPAMYEEIVTEDGTGISHSVVAQQEQVLCDLELNRDSVDGKPPPNVNPFLAYSFPGHGDYSGDGC
jgi:hypothetical protein